LFFSETRCIYGYLVELWWIYFYDHFSHVQLTSVETTGAALSAASDIHQQVPMYMADIHRDWLTNQNTDWCFVVIGVVGRQSHSPLLQLKIDPVRQMCPPSLLASSKGQRIFINICGQYGIQKNIYIHPWWRQMSWQSITQSCSVLLVVVRLQWVKARLNWLCSCCRSVLLMVNGSVSRTFTL